MVPEGLENATQSLGKSLIPERECSGYLSLEDKGNLSPRKMFIVDFDIVERQPGLLNPLFY